MLVFYLKWVSELIEAGSKSYRVWGSPLKAKKTGEGEQAAPESDNKTDAEKTFKFWPMCSLFNESQVELLEAESAPQNNN